MFVENQAISWCAPLLDVVDESFSKLLCMAGTCILCDRVSFARLKRPGLIWPGIHQEGDE